MSMAPGRVLVLAALLTFLPGSTAAQSDEATAFIERFGLREAETAMRDRPGWAPPRKIVTIFPALVDALRDVAPDAEVVAVGSPVEARTRVAGADVYIGFCTSAVMETGADLQWIQIPSAGIGACSRLPAARQSDIVFTNTQRIYGPPIAEVVIGMVLSFAKRLPDFQADQQEQRWSIGSPSDVLAAGLWELEGKTLLVVGLGGLGTEVAWRADALGMRVIATRNSRREGPEYVEYVGLAHEAGELAERADVVVNTTPLTDDTRGMFDDAFFARMKPTAFFINVGRGPSVVTDDLVAALRSGAIAGAGLDVTDPEPLPVGHPLWEMRNVIITPHVAASSDLFVERFQTLIVENVRRYVAGDALLSVVDLARGY